jgi:CAAX protease family protein
MTPVVRDTLFRIVLPSVGTALVLIVAERRDMSFQEDLGLKIPSWDIALLWLLLFVALVVVEELLGRAWGLPRPEPWSLKYHGAAKIIRTVALILIAPLSEELVFRGMLYHLVSTTALKEAGAVVLTAVVFAALHYQYSSKELLFILADGLFYGVVRYSTGSTALTIGLHMLGNSYAAYQRLSMTALVR